MDMQRRRLTALEMQKILDEQDELKGRITEYKKILGAEQRQRTTVLKELKEIVDIYGVDRKTEIIPLEDIPTYDDIPLVDEKEVPDEACIVTLSTSGKIGRTPIEGSSRTTPGQHDVLVSSTLSSTHSPVFAITTEGRALSLRAIELGEVKGRSRGVSAAKAFGTGKGELILTAISPGEDCSHFY